MYTRVKPLLSIARQEDEMRQAAEELKKTKEEMEKLLELKKQLEERNNMMERELSDLKSNAGATEDSLAEAEERIEDLMKAKFDYEERLKVSHPFPHKSQVVACSPKSVARVSVLDKLHMQRQGDIANKLQDPV